MQDTLGAGTTSEKEFRVKVLYPSCFQAQACEVLPRILHKIQDSIRFKRRHHVSVCAAQLSHWQGTVAAQTNEQLRERILFEKPGSSVTNLFSSLQDKKRQPAQTITNYPKSYTVVPNLGMTGPQIRTLPKYAERIRNRNHLKL